MSGHTPGPWRWMGPNVLVGDHGHRPVVLTSRGPITTRTEGGRLGDLLPEHPNARLIAAAPDLLAALRSVEWSGQAIADMAEQTFAPACPSCGAFAPNVEIVDTGDVKGGEHDKTCVLAAALAMVPA